MTNKNRQTKTINGSTFIINLDGVDGYSIISPSERTYDLLEGKSYCGRSTSDIVFIFEITSEGYKRLVNYLFGATDIDCCLNNCISDIISYEEGKPSNLEVDLLEW